MKLMDQMRQDANIMDGKVQQLRVRIHGYEQDYRRVAALDRGPGAAPGRGQVPRPVGRRLRPKRRPRGVQPRRYQKTH